MPKDIFLDHPDVKALKHKDKQKILSFIKLLYTKDAPINNIDNLRERQIYAANQCKLDPTDPQIIQIFNYENEEITLLINLYLGKIQNSNEYDQYQSNQWLFWNLQDKMRQPLQDNDEYIKKMNNYSTWSQQLAERMDKQKSIIWGKDPETQSAGAKIIRMTYEQRIAQKEEKNVS
jgi:hypothetical protein